MLLREHPSCHLPSLLLMIMTFRFVKAAARDVKAYLRSRNLPVMVGYASADGETWRSELASYLTCGSEALSIDLYGLNIYQVRLSFLLVPPSSSSSALHSHFPCNTS